MAKRGRRSKFDDAKDRLLSAIASGLSYEDSCAMAGISTSTFHIWRSKGEEAKSGKFFEFVAAIKRANAAATAKHVQNINRAALDGETIIETRVVVDEKGNEKEKTTTKKKTAKAWQASAWLLERRKPNEWGRNRVVDAEDNQPLPWCDDEPDPLENTKE
jgi:transposase